MVPLRLIEHPPDWPAGVKLPNAYLILVEPAKIVNYLLNPHHRFGASKARFFARFGFQIEKWQVLGGALRDHGCDHEISCAIQTRFGMRYEIEGPLKAPDGRNPRVRTVWQSDQRHIAPRLITAYPVEP